MLFLLALLFCVSITINLADSPPLWWDEGWTLLVARNWVESAHYGRLSLGQNAPPGFEAAFPTTGSIALAFYYFGVGVAQARLVIGLYLIAALALLFYLGCRFYNRRVAMGTLLVLLFMAGNRYMHPVFMARQVLAEGPSVFFLLAGFSCLLCAGDGRRPFMLGAILFWSVAIITKAQVLPFWIISLTIPLVLAIYLRQRSTAAIFAAGLLGSLVLSFAWQLLISAILIPTSSSVSGLSETVGLVTDPVRRIITLATTVQVGLPTLLGLVWAFDQLKTQKVWETYQGLVKVALFILAGSWFVWWGIASTGWPRYLFPPAFLASIFVSAMLHEWTDGFRFNAALRALSSKTRVQRIHYGAAVFLIGWAFMHTASDLADAVIDKTNAPLLQTAEYLNNQTPDSAIVETYESELFFLLKRRYHYPPDQTTVELIRREDLWESIEIDYDLLAADPDYLVVGGWCRYYKCYDSVLNAFRPVQRFGPYQIYERVRGTEP